MAKRGRNTATTESGDIVQGAFANNSSTFLGYHDNDAGYPDWDNDLTFSFKRFPAINELNQAKRAMLGVIDMLQTTIWVMYPGSMRMTEP